jgi:hypothetical protein
LVFLHALLEEIKRFPNKWPLISFMARAFISYKVVPGGWSQFYEEIAQFTTEKFLVERDTDFDAILKFNRAVMPDDSLTYPLEQELVHDVPSYIATNWQGSSEKKPLIECQAVTLSITDEYSFAQIDYIKEQYDTHQIFWELRNPVARVQSAPDWWT